MRRVVPWAWLFASGVAMSCFVEDDLEPNVDDGGSTTGTGPSSMSDPTASATMLTTEPTGTSDDPSGTATGSTTEAPPSCEGNVAEPAAGLCVRPGWRVQYQAGIVALHPAHLDGGADDLIVGVDEDDPGLGWILGGELPTHQRIAGVDPGAAQFVGPVDAEPGDDVIRIITSPRVADLQVYTWNAIGAELELESIADPSAVDEQFVAVTAAVVGGMPQIAWLNDMSYIELAPLVDLVAEADVRSTDGNGFDVKLVYRGDAPYLLACTSNGFELSPMEAMTDLLYGHPVASGNVSQCSVADIDGDGNTDVVLVRGDDLQVDTVLANPDAPVFDDIGTETLDAVPLQLAIADLDGDGDLDYAFALTGLDILRILWTGEGGVPLRGPVLRLPDVPSHVAAGDFDGDGDADLAYAIGEDVELLQFGYD
jgi:hypothetical protein